MVQSATLTTENNLNCSYHQNTRSAGQSKYMAYDMIDKAPEERERGITINTAHVSMRPIRDIMLTLTARDMPTMLRT